MLEYKQGGNFILKTYKTAFSRNLDRLIRQSGKSRKEICQETGVGYSTFTEWANGRKYPRPEGMETIAKYFGVSVSELVEAVEQPNIETTNKIEVDKKIVSRNINRLIHRCGKTRKEICKELGISYSTFTDWANGSNYPRPEGLEMLARYFGCDKSDLIEERDPSYQRLSPQEVGDIIRRRREAIGLTPADISARVGLTEAELADWESGKTADKSVSLAKRLADVLGLSFGTIIGVQSSDKKRYWKGFFQRLEEAFSGIVFTDAEIEQLIAYGKFLESQRKK